VLGFRREQSELEPSAALHRLEVEPFVFVTLLLGGREALLELVQAPNDFSGVDHEIFLIEARSSVNQKRSRRSFFDATQ
jgi:hypothetical protein